MFKKILVPVNLEDTQPAQHAMAVAVDAAQRHAAELNVVTVVPGFGMPLVASFFPENAMQEAKKAVASRLTRYVAETVPGHVKTATKVMEGTPWECILSHAQNIGADLIVIPSHDRSKAFGATLLGSCAAKVAEHARCSVLVVRH